MTQNTQGGIARCPKCKGTDIIMFDSDNDMCKNCKHYGPPTEFESPLPASPEGTDLMPEEVEQKILTEAELQSPYNHKEFMRRKCFIDGFVIGGDYTYKSFIQPLLQENEFKRNMIADLDSMNERLKQENTNLQSQLAEAREALDRFKQSLKDNEGMEYE